MNALYKDQSFKFLLLQVQRNPHPTPSPYPFASPFPYHTTPLVQHASPRVYLQHTVKPTNGN